MRFSGCLWFSGWFLEPRARIEREVYRLRLDSLLPTAHFPSSYRTTPSFRCWDNLVRYLAETEICENQTRRTFVRCFDPRMRCRSFQGRGAAESGIVFGYFFAICVMALGSDSAVISSRNMKRVLMEKIVLFLPLVWFAFLWTYLFIYQEIFASSKKKRMLSRMQLSENAATNWFHFLWTFFHKTCSRQQNLLLCTLILSP